MFCFFNLLLEFFHRLIYKLPRFLLCNVRFLYKMTMNTVELTEKDDFNEINSNKSVLYFIVFSRIPQLTVDIRRKINTVLYQLLGGKYTCTFRSTKRSNRGYKNTRYTLWLNSFSIEKTNVFLLHYIATVPISVFGIRISSQPYLRVISLSFI